MVDANQKVQGPWLDVKQVAFYLSMTERAVRDLEYRGALLGHRLGRSLRFSQPKLDKMLALARQPTLYEMGSREIDVPPGPLGPLMTPEDAAEYLGLPSTEALQKRALRLQIPAYRISERIMRYRAVELDQAIANQQKPLTRYPVERNLKSGACLPEGKEEYTI
jgi:hypothetical protein